MKGQVQFFAEFTCPYFYLNKNLENISFAIVIQSFP